MTGVLNAMVGSAPGFRYTVTIGNSGSLYGYNDSAGPMGAVSPTTYNGITIRVIAVDNSGTPSLTFTLSGTRSQSFFAGLEIQKTDGTFLRLHTNSVSSFDSSSGLVTIWNWVVSGVWTATSPSTRAVRVF